MNKKRKPQRPSRPQKISLFVYVDESGNTGQNLFDENQPYFWAGALVSVNNLDKTALKAHGELIGVLGVKELHGSQFGIDGIKKIALRLIKLFTENNCRFAFTLIEKRFYAAVSLAWLLLDSDYNRGVGHFHSLVSIFHRMLAIDIIKGLTPGEIKEFWSVYGKRELTGFVRILDNLRIRVCDHYPDKRGRELLMDALDWASSHPEEILRGKRTSRDSVNVFALLYILDGIREVTNGRGQVYKFVHDEQKQFGSSLRETYEMAKNVKVEERNPLLGVMKLERDPIAVCPIDFLPSKASVGVQLIDIVLWLKRQQIEGTTRSLPNECQALLDYVDSRGTIRTFLYSEVKERTMAEYIQAMSRPLSSEQEAKARARAEEIERHRRKRMGSDPDS